MPTRVCIRGTKPMLYRDPIKDGFVNSRDVVSALFKKICILPTNYFNCVEAVVWSKRDAVPLWISPLGARQISAPRPRSDSELLFDRVANVRHASLVWLHRSARVASELFSMVYGFSCFSKICFRIRRGAGGV